MRTPCHVPTPPARRARDRAAEGRPGPAGSALRQLLAQLLQHTWAMLASRGLSACSPGPPSG